MNRNQILDWFRESPESKFGSWAEMFWSNVFHSAGLKYVQMCKIAEGGAPMQHGECPLILPDFSVGNHAFTVCVDSKAKRSPVFFRLAAEWRHGIERRHYNHYREFADLNRVTCCLAVFEAFTAPECATWSGMLLVQSLQKLGPPYLPSAAAQRRPDYDVVLWPRSRFAEVGRVEPEETVGIVNYHGGGVRFKTRLLEVLELEGQEPTQKLLF